MERRENITNRILYTSKQYDQETGQYYLRARYYNPVGGRFLQEDTYRGDGLNLYAYCANNPVVYYDPSGHSFFSKLKEWCKKLAEAFMEDTPAGEVIGEGGLNSKYLEQLNGFLGNKINHIINGSKGTNHGWENLVPEKIGTI